MRMTTRLRRLMASGHTLVAPGCYSALSDLEKYRDSVGYQPTR